MDFANSLQVQLLSETNIQFIVNKLLADYRISQKAIGKCKNIVINYLQQYLNNINILPQNNSQLIEAIEYLNKKCYDDFTTYLTLKYPKNNFLRPHNNLPPISHMTDIPELETLPHGESITIIDEDEKIKILKEAGYNTQYESPNPNNYLLYLSDPKFMEILKMMINNCNNMTIKKTNDNLVFDEILDFKQVDALIKHQNKENEGKKNNENIENIKEDKQVYDLSNLTINNLDLIKNRADELNKLKEKYLLEKNEEMAKKINDEQKQIIEAISVFKEKTKIAAKEAKEKESELNKSIVTNKVIDNIEYLDLLFDPTNDYNDMKNIIIEIKSDKKISEILLINYFLPFNNNNITRFNNKFIIYSNGQNYKIIIPPGKYDLMFIINYIKNYIPFLDFNISDTNIITIKNLMGNKFELSVGKDTIFNVLGFTANEYKGEIYYKAHTPYNIKSNEKIFFHLSGTPMDPLEMEFDKEITINKILRKSRTGVTIRKLILHFGDDLGQWYDFIKPFNMKLKITYLI